MYWSPSSEPGNPEIREQLVTAIHEECWVLGGGHGSRQSLCVVTRTRSPAVTELSPTVWKAELTLGFNKTIGYSNALESQSHKSGNDSHSLVMKNSPPHAVWDRGATKQTVSSTEEGLSWRFLSLLSEIPSQQDTLNVVSGPFCTMIKFVQVQQCASKICFSDFGGMGSEAARISPHILHALNSQKFMRKAQYKEQFLKISLVETDR